MALIICKECGNKVSDTVERCIHCGAPTALSIPKPEAQEVKPEVQEVKPEVQATKPEKPVTKPPKVAPAQENYYAMGENRRIQLEADFLEHDPWAEKYRRKGMELKAFRDLFIPSAGIVAVLGFHYYLIAVLGFEVEFANLFALKIGIYVAIGLFVVSAVLAQIFSFLVKRYDKSRKKLIYLKRFQYWLKKEKNIRMNPVIDDEREQEYFDSIKLDDLNY